MISSIVKLIMLIVLLAAQVCASAQTTAYQLPGTADGELKMRGRLIAIAEGLPPGKDLLEAEFGFAYQKSPSFSDQMQDFVATGPFPFNPGHASFHSYKPLSRSPRTHFVSFVFAEPSQLLADGKKPFCVPRTTLVKEFQQNGWEYRQWTVPPHNMREDGLFLTVNGIAREVHIWPIQAGCAKTFSVRYVELAAGN